MSPIVNIGRGRVVNVRGAINVGQGRVVNVGSFPWNLAVKTQGRWLASAIPQAANTLVASWGDMIGGCGAITQAVAAKQPVLTANQINGRPAVVFDGVDDFLKVTFPAGVSQPFCYFFVLKPGGGAGSGYLIDGVESAASGHRAYVAPGWAYGAPTWTAGTASDTAWHRGVASFNGASSFLRIDGTNVSTANPGANSTTGITLGSQWDQAGGTFHALTIAELVICQGAPTAADLAQWARYVSQEYGI